jgi:polysaccharide biosynthesis transport protein
VKARVIGALLNHVDMKGGRFGADYNAYSYYRGYGGERDERTAS